MSFICRIAPAFIENAQFSGFVLENGNCKSRRINECLLGTHSCDVNAECLGNCSNCNCRFLFQIKTRKMASTVCAFLVLSATVFSAMTWTSARFEKAMKITAKIFSTTQNASILLAVSNANAFLVLF